MKLSFYPILAWDGIRKNRRLYLPYFLTCIGMVAMYYIIVFLAFGDALNDMPKAQTVKAMMDFGGSVIAVFACIFLFYTNSFLIRRRMKELGLYHILGMNKNNIVAILFWETVITVISALLGGLIVGTVFSKLAEITMVKLIHGTLTFSFSFSTKALMRTVILFLFIFALIFLNSLLRIYKTNSISLLRSETAGEKPPKANWLLGLLGAVILIIAYTIAVKISNPLGALNAFFIAAGLVVIATYLLMIAGSVLLCRILQKNKKYYYKPNHFVPVSSMAFRMKRNGAGLASICCLSIMILVILASTTTLYFGCGDAVNHRFPAEINAKFTFTPGQMTESNISSLHNELSAELTRSGITPETVLEYCSYNIFGQISDTVLNTDYTTAGFSTGLTMDNVFQVALIPLFDYNRMTGTNHTLKENEILLYSAKADYSQNTLTLAEGIPLTVKEHLKESPINDYRMIDVIPALIIICDNPEYCLGNPGNKYLSDNEPLVTAEWHCYFNTGVPEKKQIALTDILQQKQYAPYISTNSVECRAIEEVTYFSIIGGFFYLGLLLSLVFVFATVLIIYYKQISEGYEDCARFEIMRKIGMTDKEIRKNINSQLLIVFFLPLLGAGCHLCFAFPMIQKLLQLFGLNNTPLYILITALSFVVFALFYTVVYRITSNAYYNIVRKSN